MFKALVKKLDSVADEWLPLAQLHDEKVIAWANLHGWNASSTEHQHLLIRQALFNALIRQTVPAVTPHVFSTPLDSLGIEAPHSLANVVHEEEYKVPTATFNFWGELYGALIPQPQRRRIGQFWTNEQIAEWMVAWLLQSRPGGLVDIGCGAGNFLLKAAQYQGKSRTAPKLYGLDLSPVLLNATLAAFLQQDKDKPGVMPILAAQNYLATPPLANIDAVICNPPYTRHHHIAPEVKDELQAFFKTRFYFDVSRQATLAFYFLLKLIAEMPEGAQAAVIVQMEVLDARYGQSAKRALCQHTSLSAIIHFSPQLNAFHKVDVGASILLFRKGYTKNNLVSHLTLNTLPTTDELLACLEVKHSGKPDCAFGSLMIQPQGELLDVPKWFSIATPKRTNAAWESTGLV
ncbi:MAG: N-6 DNA methylase, partial [Nitrososphaerales archaeon]